MQAVAEQKQKRRKHKSLNRLPRMYLPPLCPKHLLPMYAGSSPPRITYYYCRVGGCGCSLKVIRGKET